MTDIRIDDFVVVDFNGLSKVVDSLGGVHVQVDEAIDDPDYTGMKLDEGCQKLDGQTALQYARVRHGVGDGSDISRISRQQKLMNAMASKALSSNLLTQSGFLTSTLETLTTSEHIGQIGNLSGLAYSVQGVGMDKINFITMPNEQAADENRVVPSENAKKVWKAIKEDKTIPAEAAAPAATDAGATADDQAASEEGPTGSSEADAATTQAPQTQAPQTGTSAAHCETKRPGVPRLRQDRRRDSDRRLAPALDHSRIRSGKASTSATSHRRGQPAQPRTQRGTL